MAKRIIGAIIGMLIGFVIFNIANSGSHYSTDQSALITICLLLGGILVAYIAGKFKPKS